ncbi:MAG: sugar-binding domain-containing protein [Ignavibacteriaceae bacterium]
MNKSTTAFSNAVIFFILLFFSFIGNITAQNKVEGRERLLMDYNWKFHLGDTIDADKFSFDDSNWRTLNLPHDWSIEGTFSQDAPAGGNGGYLPTGIGWYRKHFEITKNDLSKKIWIEFDGVYMNSNVWINGNHLGLHPYGYTSFYYDLTPYLKEGENIVAVRVDNSLQPNSRWYTGSGIYRNVWLVKLEPLHISHWGVYVTTPEVSKESAIVKVRTKIDNNYKSFKKGFLIILIF